MYTIQVVGAGYLGFRIASFFAAKKQKVFAVTRSEQKGKALENEGVHPILADLEKTETLTALPPAHFIVICVAPDQTDAVAYEAVYLKGVASYLNAIRKNPKPFLVVYVSSTGVWQDQAGDFFDETVEPLPQSPKAKILVEAEKQILKSGLPSVVLRLSGIYGPGRNRLKAFRDGRWPEAGTDRWMNLIHADDVAAMMPEFFKKVKEGEIYLGTDDEPIRLSALRDWLALQTGISSSFSFECGVSGRRLKNDKLKSLGIRLKYPTFREGYASIIKEEYL